jgi:hypothetical protein
MDKESIEKEKKKKHYHENVECFEKHLGKYFENDEMTVFHEIASMDFHLDVYFIQPKNEQYNLLITSGMSLLEMQVPERIKNKEDYLFAELMLLIPKELEFDKTFPNKESNKNAWIIDMIKQTARFPHHHDTFLTESHTLQAWTDITQPYDKDTNFVGCILLPSATFDENFMQLTCDDRKITVHSLFLLYENELEYKLQNGYDEFFNLLIEGDVKEIFDNNRKNLIENNEL